MQVRYGEYPNQGDQRLRFHHSSLSSRTEYWMKTMSCLKLRMGTLKAGASKVIKWNYSLPSW
jgi:hypothetical protein